MTKTEYSACKAFCYEWKSSDWYVKYQLCQETQETCPIWKKLMAKKYQTKDQFINACSSRATMITRSTGEEIITEAILRRIMHSIINQACKYSLDDMAGLVREYFQENVSEY